MAPWTARRSGDIVFIKTLLYTGVRVAELVSIRLGDVDLDACRIRITQGKGAKDRYVPFPATFKETLALHISAARDNGTAGPIPVTRPLPVRSGPAGGQQINAHSGTQPFPGTWRPRRTRHHILAMSDENSPPVPPHASAAARPRAEPWYGNVNG